MIEALVKAEQASGGMDGKGRSMTLHKVLDGIAAEKKTIY